MTRYPLDVALTASAWVYSWLPVWSETVPLVEVGVSFTSQDLELFEADVILEDPAGVPMISWWRWARELTDERLPELDAHRVPPTNPDPKLLSPEVQEAVVALLPLVRRDPVVTSLHPSDRAIIEAVDAALAGRGSPVGTR